MGEIVHDRYSPFAGPSGLGDRFSWTTFDVRGLLPVRWREQLLAVARDQRSNKTLRPPHATSREGEGIDSLPVLTVRGSTVWSELPWVVDLYRTTFRDLIQGCVAESVLTTDDQRYAVVINVQEADGTRYECHVDTNPLEALLYVTSHPPGTGGELVVANSRGASSVAEVDRDATVLYPQEGHLVFFDGRHHPHYVRPLLDGGLRVAVAMNYYLESFPESTRPDDLNRYLYGTA